MLWLHGMPDCSAVLIIALLAPTFMTAHKAGLLMARLIAREKMLVWPAMWTGGICHLQQHCKLERALMSDLSNKVVCAQPCHARRPQRIHTVAFV